MMGVTGLRIWTRTGHSGSLKLLNLSGPNKGQGRRHANHNSLNMDFGNADTSLLKQAKGSGRTLEVKHDYAGPFQLGISPSSLRQGEKVSKWSELNTRGKVLRTTARTTNLGVILLGAGLSVLLIYSLTSELFSQNSPTVLYGDACERIRNSERLANYLNSPLTFHNNPPSAVRPRHRNRHVTSRVMVDQYGQEHMIMTFYVQGRPEGEVVPVASGASYFEVATTWIQDKTAILSECSFDDAVSWTQESARTAWDKSIAAFKYLSGDPLPPPPLPVTPPVEKENVIKQTDTPWSFAGIFSSLRSPRNSATVTSPKLPVGKNFTDGEVHADLVKNKDGYFVFRYLLVDIPSSKDPKSIRIFIEREPGIRETEPVSS